MQLRKIEIQGFKSFADKTTIELLDGITTIVGPNGSGKSNISDAIRWVLGEQSIKTLRGSKMEDIIFAGTQNRRKVGFAQVSMFLDNSDHVLPIEYNEVVVSRRLYRDGQSTYIINDSECRLKDVQELFMDTGIGKDGYSIISQGKIDEILSNKSEERRAIFEEAAGIVKYRNRKEEANKKLENTNLNLLRVNDVLLEIENNIGSLEEKANIAKKYLTLKEETKLLDIRIFLKNIEQNVSKLADLEDIIKTFKLDEIKEEENYSELEKEKIELKERIQNSLEKIEQVQAKYYELEAEIEKLNYNINLTNEKISNNKINIERLETELKEDEQNIVKYEQEYSEKLDKEESLKQSRIKFETEFNEKQEEYKKLLETLDKSEIEKEKFKLEIDELSEEINDKKIENSSHNATINANIKQIELITENNMKLKEQLQDINLLFSNIDGQINEKQSKLNQINENVTNLQTEITSKNTLKENCIKIEQDLKQELLTLKSKYNYLNNLENENEGYYKSVKFVLDYVKQNNIKNVYGTVASIISTEEKFEYAIEIAIGGYLQNVIVETEEDAKHLINYLKTNSYGRTTFLPINSIKSYPEYDYSKLKNMQGFLGMATHLINYDKKYSNIINLILNKTVIVDNIDNAIKISKQTKNSVKIVTLSGELISQTGSMTGGKNSTKSSSLIGRNEKVKGLKEKIETIQLNYDKKFKELNLINEKITELNNNYEIGKNELNVLKFELDSLIQKKENTNLELEKINTNQLLNVETVDKLTSETEKLTESIRENNKNIDIINLDIVNKKEIIENYLKQNKEKEEYINALNEDIVDLKISLSSFDDSKEAINEVKQRINQDIENLKISINKKQEQILLYNNFNNENIQKIGAIEKEIEDLLLNKDKYITEVEQLKLHKAEDIQKQDIVEIKLVQNINKVNKIKEEILKVQNKKSKFELEIENQKNFIWNEYELTITSAEEYLKNLKFEELDDKLVIKKLQELKNELKNLGPVDVNSIEEYKQVKERFEFISKQKLDLEQTKQKLENLISNMTSIMKQQFSKQFKLINENFEKTFKELFGGGKSELKLSDESNILESGIEIEVQPPGKKLQNMSLLSGGERALTAISLLFAILQIKAPPFCILDEIEAALDDVNVHRFAEYIKKYSKDTQFVVITHRKGTMEVASSVYGVTMQEYGVSQIVSMKLV